MEVSFKMEIYVLHHYWDTPDNEGNEIIGAYYKIDNAVSEMRAEAEITKSYYPADFWEDDFTWENDNEIHLGNCSTAYSNECFTATGLATIYCWEIKKVEVK